MFNKKTTIVVGAGASKEARLPTGAELKKKIASVLDIKFDDWGRNQSSGDRVVREALSQVVTRDISHDKSINPYLHAAWRIRDAMPQAISIDNFIDAHQGDGKLELCGKLAIVKSILEAERRSLLYVDTSKTNPKLNYNSLDNTWFNAFLQLLTENCRVDQLGDRLSSIALIIFNYDRCIEHYLFHSLQNYYGIDATKAASLVRGIKIYHPYGTVGGLPWYEGTHRIEFGGEVNASQLVELAGQIKTFTEGTDPESSDVVAIRNAMDQSQIVIFLGFAFHRLNLDLIQPTGNAQQNSAGVNFFGTALGISDSDCDVISTEIANKLGGGKPILGLNLRNNLSCSQLFREYWRSLSLS